MGFLGTGLLTRTTLGMLAVAAMTAVACGGSGDEDADASPGNRSTITVQITTVEPSANADAATTEPAPTNTAADPDGGEVVTEFTAADAAIVVDGDTSDWDGIAPVTVTLEQIKMGGLSPSDAEDIEFDELPPIDSSLRVATDGSNIYVLLEVPDGFDHDPNDHGLSPAIAVQFRIDNPAEVHMGSEEADLDESLGMVDMWHWELDCGPGLISGGQGVSEGNDPACNFDDEYAVDPEDREDDGGGDPNPGAENSLTGVWEHTGRSAGPGADGVWIFEMSRPLQTGDPEDAQFESGGVAALALAYWDPNESAVGWSDAGHLTSSYVGWLEVTLP